MHFSSFGRNLLRRFIAPAVLLAALPLFLVAADNIRRGQTESALDRYVAQPDAHFSWEKVTDATLAAYAEAVGTMGP